MEDEDKLSWKKQRSKIGEETVEERKLESKDAFKVMMEESKRRKKEKDEREKKERLATTDKDLKQSLKKKKGENERKPKMGKRRLNGKLVDAMMMKNAISNTSGVKFPSFWGRGTEKVTGDGMERVREDGQLTGDKGLTRQTYSVMGQTGPELLH